eukprot:9837012-Ditylum_brightwellii.AAC.1
MIIVENHKVMMSEYLLDGNFGIELIEATNHTENRGKWFILYKKRYAKRVHHFVDTMFAQIFEDSIIPENRYPMVFTPGRARASVSSFIGSYADTLQKMSENPKEDDSFSTNVAPAELRKRPATAISLEEFPQLNGDSTSTVTTATTTTK